MKFHGAAITLLMLLACWPAWELGGWIVAETGLFALDLPIRVTLLVLLLNLLGERLDRAETQDH
jgi:hypothetical protein